MKEIKFRAWDNEEGEMHTDVGIDESGTPYKFPEDYAFMDMAVDSATYWPCANIMQYTGLKDKNGVEIYEGDIVVDRFDNLESTMIVEWSGTGFEPFADRDILGNLDQKNYEVIGNIYENPELLEAK